MGLWLSKLMNLFGEREARILVLGLDNAGKTTILCERQTCNCTTSQQAWPIASHQLLPALSLPASQTGCKWARWCQLFPVRTRPTARLALCALQEPTGDATLPKCRGSGTRDL